MREGQQGREQEVRTVVPLCVLIECTSVVDVPADASLKVLDGEGGARGGRFVGIVGTNAV